MTEVRRNTLVGLFMIVGLGVLGSLMVMFGETPSWLGGAEYELGIVVREKLTGIEDGTPIYLNGIKIGRVSEIVFVDETAPEEGVVVFGLIEERYRVPGNVTAECYGPVLGVGRGRIEIMAKASTKQPLKPGDKIPGTMAPVFGDLIPDTMLDSLETTVVSIGQFADELTPVANDLHELLRKRPIDEVDSPEAAARGTLANLYTAVQRLDRILKNLDDVVGDPKVKDDIRTVVANMVDISEEGKLAVADLRSATGDLRGDAARAADRLEQSLVNFDTQTQRLADAAIPALDESARTASNLRSLSDGLMRGEGTLGMLLKDERLYEVVVLSFERAVDAINSLRRLFAHFERTGRIGINTQTSVGPVNVDKKIEP